MAESSFIEVHVFGGATEGEGIILKLPDGQWGIIDSCVGKAPGQATTFPMIEFLQAKGVKRLSFVCLTHPHEDHFRGMLKVLKSFKPDQFWYPAAMTHERLSQMLEYRITQAQEQFDWNDLDSLDELKEIFFEVSERVKEARRQKVPKFRAELLTINKLVYSNGQHNKIIALTPNGNDIVRYEDTLRSCFDANGQISNVRVDLKHNQISIGLLVATAKFNIVFGGDVEKPSWTRSLQDCHWKSWASALFKISHHGSEGATSQQLTDRVFRRDRTTIGVVTGYKCSRLPSAKMVQHFQALTDELYLTHNNHHVNSTHQVQAPAASHAALAKTFVITQRNDSLATQSQQAMNTQFSNLQVVRTADVGRCSFHFGKNGQLQHREVNSPALHLVVAAANKASVMP